MPVKDNVVVITPVETSTLITTTTDRRAGLTDVDAVLSSFRPGGFQARVLDERPDAVVLDVLLPGIDGFAVCRKMVEAYRGAIAAENLPGGGCEFSVVVPALG